MTNVSIAVACFPSYNYDKCSLTIDEFKKKSHWIKKNCERVSKLLFGKSTYRLFVRIWATVSNYYFTFTFASLCEAMTMMGRQAEEWERERVKS